MEITDAAVRVDPHGEAAAADTTVIATENQLSIAGSLSTWVGKGTAVDRTRWASLSESLAAFGRRTYVPPLTVSAVSVTGVY
jgi:hypothetical protein